MKAYSLDLRERAIAMVRAGEMTQAQIAQVFGVSQATLENWWRRWRTTNTVAAKPFAGGAVRALKSCARLIRELVKSQPDATLQELCAQVQAQTGVRASPSMMCRELQHLQLPRKKVSARQSARNAARASLAPRLSGARERTTRSSRRPSQIHR